MSRTAAESDLSIRGTAHRHQYVLHDLLLHLFREARIRQNGEPPVTLLGRTTFYALGRRNGMIFVLFFHFLS